MLRFRDDGVPVLREFPGAVPDSVPDTAVPLQHAAGQVLLRGADRGGRDPGRHLLHELLQLHDDDYYEHIRRHPRCLSWRCERGPG